MSKKVIRLTEADLEKIVMRVIQESDDAEVGEQLDKLRAKASGAVAGLNQKRDNMKAMRQARRDARNVGVADKRAVAQLKSLTDSLKRDVTRAKENFDSVFTDEVLSGLDQNIAGQVDRYYNALGVILDTDFMAALGES